MIPTKVVAPLPSTFIILGIIFTRLHSKFLQKNVYPSVQKFASPRERHLYDFFPVIRNLIISHQKKQQLLVSLKLFCHISDPNQIYVNCILIWDEIISGSNEGTNPPFQSSHVKSCLLKSSLPSLSIFSTQVVGRQMLVRKLNEQFALVNEGHSF